jgi:hypothetical protein
VSGIVVNKAAQGWQPSSARPSCSNCTLVRRQEASHQGFNGPSFYCGKGGFYTSAMAICREHKPTTPVRDVNTKEMFS